MDTKQPSLGIMVASALIAVVLQLVVAPLITIFGVVPNFILVLVIINAMHNSPLRSTIMGFILGLVLDLCSLGPIGAMALVLTILAYATSSLNKRGLSGETFIDALILLAAVVLGEFLVSVIYAVVGVGPEFLLLLVQRVLPAIVYDALVGFIFLLIYSKVVGNKHSGKGGGTGRTITRKLTL